MTLRYIARTVCTLVSLDMASMSLQPVPPFAVDTEIGLSLSSDWKFCLRDFDTFLLASGIMDKKRQRTLFLYEAGPQVREIFA